MSRKASLTLSQDRLDEAPAQVMRLIFDPQMKLDASFVDRELQPREMLDHLPDLIYVKDRQGRFVFANAAAMRKNGLNDGTDMIGRTVFDFLDAEGARRISEAEQELIRTGEAMVEREERVITADGRTLWLSISKTPLRDEQGRVVGLVGVTRDITERKRQEERRRGHARLLEMIARGQPLQAVLDALVGAVEDELDGITASLLLMAENHGVLRNGASTNMPPDYVELIDRLPVGPKVGSCGTAAWRRTPVFVEDVLSDPLWEDYRHLALRFGFRSCWSTPILSADGSVLGTFGLYSNAPRLPTALELELAAMATDIAGIAIERSRAEARIRHMAHHDPLTGLPNRTLFAAQFSRALHEARREGRKVTVAYIDMDNFKQMNDTLGHAAGDEVLKTLASRMAGCIRACDMVVRLGGDEFAIVFSNRDHDEAGVLRRLQEIRAAVFSPISVAGTTVTATCSMGVAFFPRDGETPEALLARADRAMYEAKKHGRDRLWVSGGEDF